MFRKVLVANRGEIALRVIRACHELGIATVAVYSDADRSALHVQAATEAVYIGASPALESYLNMARIIEVAQETGAEAIHPGYGFLAENPEFVRLCEEKGVVFIGPNSKAMALVGDKIRSREVVEKVGVPIIPGMKESFDRLEDYLAAAQKIGYPVMIKASAGGGGKGMRIVYREEDLIPGLEAGRREAKAAFGDESVYLEKYIEEPRHVEFQVLADNWGNVIHLFERECSIQRRHQKIIEETPSVAVDDNLRLKMGEAAKKVMQTVGYNNAGTVEFLLDKDKNFYFLEVNARLQVEHPVTELTTGVDLVHQQLKIAAGEKLSLSQEQVSKRGHALECRIYAEDPAHNFLPSSGRIICLREPAGPGIRLDSGVYAGFEVPIYYDPILAKLITWGESREMACFRMKKALENYVVLGIKTTIPFLAEVVEHPAFLEGKISTHFIARYFNDWQPPAKSEEGKRLALIGAVLQEIERGKKRQLPGEAVKDKSYSPWQSLSAWRLGRRS
ncbi:MAG TPA: acetyl-CoA carboxylase biotin carboxylase subunit [Candidatus Aminicenantes bacterium]|nr:acetyl-CoA carboxylase biotin carboxylase subunit [Candidatus Aminicenantes bacterium]